MTIPEAIEMIDEQLAEPNSMHKDWTEVLQMCKDALQKREPKKAKYLMLGQYTCPACGHLIDTYEIGMFCCQECLQVLTW